jgi:hypothetical protein
MTKRQFDAVVIISILSHIVFRMFVVDAQRITQNGTAGPVGKLASGMAIL